MSNSLNSLTYLTATISENKTATALPDSKGLATQRIAFDILNNHPEVSIATRSLTSAQSIQAPENLKLGFIEKFFWAPISYYNASSGEYCMVLVNRSSAYKRLSALGFSKQEITNALNRGSLDSLFISYKSRCIEEKLFPPSSLLDQINQTNVRRAITHNFENKFISAFANQSFVQTNMTTEPSSWNIFKQPLPNTIITTTIPIEEGKFKRYIIFNNTAVDLETEQVYSTNSLKVAYDSYARSEGSLDIEHQLELAATAPEPNFIKACNMYLRSDKTQTMETLLSAIEHVETHKDSWIAEKKALTTTISGIEVSYEPEGNYITLKIGHRYFDFENGDFAMRRVKSSYLSDQDILSIYDYIGKEGPKKFDAIRQKREAHPNTIYFFDIFVTPKESGLARAIQFAENGKVYVHFNRKSSAGKDKLIGKGGNKTVTLATNLKSDKFFASGASRYVRNKTNYEFRNHRFLKDVPGFVETESMVAYDASHKPFKSRCKCKSEDSGLYCGRILTKLYSIDLLDALNSGTLSKEDKKSITVSLIQGLATLHKMGYVHRDIKPDNIFLTTNSEGKKVAVIADLESVSSITTDKDRFKKSAGTCDYMAPEYAEAYLPDELNVLMYNPRLYMQEKAKLSSDLSNRGAAATTQALDVWALGCTLNHLLSKNNNLLWMGRFEKDYALAAIRRYAKEKPNPSFRVNNGLEKLIYDMLRVDPKNRITAEELLQRLDTLDWSDMDEF